MTALLKYEEMKKKQPELMFECKTCPKRFQCKSWLKRHE